MKILLVEDDLETAAYVSGSLKEHGNAVEHAAEGRAGLLLAASGNYDVLIVDWMLPGLDGLALVKTVRAAGVKTPILFLTTRSGIDDRVEGLESGGDDYLVKPFAFSELLARVNALSRRPPLAEDIIRLRVADLEIDILKRTATRAGHDLGLKSTEFKLLEFLMRNAGRIVTRSMLLEKVWDFHFDPQTNVVETNISRLRSKVDRGFEFELIHTVRGAGYSLRAPE
ncbi:MAG: response regulator transcription factor [Desulfovibrionaceae bacterium]|nr:response regulator transcription factor [Desulfovibrionaceae bacterium]MBF0513840.1 response regulator transcription factor [Desulfovibrionaceae bacterium]